MSEHEEWRPIPGFPGYEVSNLGRVVSTKRGDARVLKVGKADRHGYRRVMLCTNGQRVQKGLHQWVALAFYGPAPAGAEVRHLDGDSLNNQASNLAYGSRSENARDTLRHGTHSSASKTHCPQGHPYDEKNTGTTRSRNWRRCLTCHRDREARRRSLAVAS